jgi:hypothetical protein
VGLIDHLPDGLGVSQVGPDDRVTVTRQPGQYLGRQAGRPAVVHRHPVALPGERLGHRTADTPRSSRHQYRSLRHRAPSGPRYNCAPRPGNARPTRRR